MTHTSSPERIMLTDITDLIRMARMCQPDCPLMNTLVAIKESLKTEVRQKGENDRDQRP
ncbi:unnamed protein product [marine sediment metagenome]|uniref:Uncharacterized protein n=1 Tax=marine sediment metagenome TaxID=412755 RepID=X0YE75_9ZZZZ